jgi:D-psicose/D-tagatose/L-ribulose 3-epimerase
VWTDGRTQEGLEKAKEQAAECGYRIIELAYLRPDEFDLDRLSKRGRAADLAIVVTMGLPVSSDDPNAVRAGETLLSNAVKAVRDIGGIRLGGILYSAHGKYAQMPTEKGRKHSIAAIANIAKEAGVELVLEIVNRFETNLLNTAQQGLDFIRRTGSDHIRLHLDTFHMNIEEVDPAMAIRLAGDRIGYFHIGESNRGYLGAGTINFDRILDALVDIGYDRDIVFESFSSTIVDQSLSVACGIWRDTWTDNVPLAKHARQFIELRYEEAKRRRATAIKP